MKIILFVFLLIFAPFYQKKEVKINIFNKEDNSRINSFKVFYKPHSSKKYQIFNYKKSFSFGAEDEIDILVITKNKRVLFEQINSKYINEAIRYNFHISGINNSNSTCVYYYNLAVSIIGKNRLNEEDCSDILFVIGPLNDSF